MMNSTPNLFSGSAVAAPARKKELWSDVPEFEGYYQASTHGRVRSLDRLVEQKNRWGHIKPRLYSGKVLSPHVATDRHGYQIHQVRLNIGGQGRTFSVHRVMAATFLGPRPEGQLAIFGAACDYSHLRKYAWPEAISQHV